MVAGFIGQGMVVPAEIRALDGAGMCRARVLGADFRLRCPAAQRPVTAAQVSVHPRELVLADGNGAGIAGRVKRLVYCGGYRRAEIAPDDAPDMVLQVDAPDGLTLEAGAAVRVSIHDGWVIPAPTS